MVEVLQSLRPLRPTSSYPTMNYGRLRPSLEPPQNNQVPGVPKVALQLGKRSWGQKSVRQPLQSPVAEDPDEIIQTKLSTQLREKHRMLELSLRRQGALLAKVRQQIEDQQQLKNNAVYRILITLLHQQEAKRRAQEELLQQLKDEFSKQSHHHGDHTRVVVTDSQLNVVKMSPPSATVSKPPPGPPLYSHKVGTAAQHRKSVDCMTGTGFSTKTDRCGRVPEKTGPAPLRRSQSLHLDVICSLPSSLTTSSSSGLLSASPSYSTGTPSINSSPYMSESHSQQPSPGSSSCSSSSLTSFSTLGTASSGSHSHYDKVQTSHGAGRWETDTEIKLGMPNDSRFRQQQSSTGYVPHSMNIHSNTVPVTVNGGFTKVSNPALVEGSYYQGGTVSLPGVSSFENMTATLPPVDLSQNSDMLADMLTGFDREELGQYMGPVSTMENPVHSPYHQPPTAAPPGNFTSHEAGRTYFEQYNPSYFTNHPQSHLVTEEGNTLNKLTGGRSCQGQGDQPHNSYLWM